MPIKDPIKRKEYEKQRRERTKEERAAYQKKYREENKEKLKQNRKDYYANVGKTKYNEGKLSIEKTIKYKIYRHIEYDKKFGECETLNYIEASELIEECKGLCHYCNKSMKFIRENNCDPDLFTFDRIDNNQSHHKYNLVVSCLDCNMKRKNTEYEIFKNQSKELKYASICELGVLENM